MIVRVFSICLFVLSFAIVLLTDGGVYPLSLSVATIAMGLALATAAAQHRLHRKTMPVFISCLAAWLFLSAWMSIQAVPLPGEVLSNPAWERLAEHGLSSVATISIAPGNAVYSLLPFGLAFMTLLTTLILFQTDRQALAVLRVVGIVGAALALLAIVQFTFFPSMLMFAPKQDYLSSLTAPFVNRNTAATFYGLVLVVLLVNLALDVPAGRSSSYVAGASHTRYWWLTAGMAALVLLALVLTTSRGGIAASFASVGGLAFALFMSRWRARMRRSRFGAAANRWYSRIWPFVLAAAVAIIVATSVWFLLERTVLRFGRMGGEDGRFCVYPAVIAAIEDNMLTGIGAGALESYLPAYRDPSCGLLDAWVRAHDGYLDMVLAFGVIAATILLLGALIIVSQAVRTGLRQRIGRKPVVLGCLSATVLLLMHSLVDFSLQIPGVFMLSSVVLATSVTVSLNRPGRNAGSSRYPAP